MNRRQRRAGTAALLLAAAGAAQAGSPRLCQHGVELSPAQKDGRLRLVARLRQELDAQPATAVLISRSGVDLSRFAQRYSHAGISLRDSPNTPWSVRQLYYACDEGRPRLFDQGLAGFLLAADDQAAAHVSLVLLPSAATQALRAAALDNAAALALLAGSYSASAYPFSTRHQNCNQWVAELFAVAWGDLGPGPTRERAQQWLHDSDYSGHRFEPSPWLLLAAPFVPLLHLDDHPADDLEAARLQISMPSALEAFVHRRHPDAQRIELCQDEHHIVVRHGWVPMDGSCRAAPGDQVIVLGNGFGPP